MNKKKQWAGAGCVWVALMASGWAVHPAAASDCTACHDRVTPQIVYDWSLGKHGQLGIDCSACHGSGHRSADDVDQVSLPTPETCAQCHPQQVQQFTSGKHALAWMTMEAMPTIHWQPMALTEGMKGCGGCHKIGLKSPEQMRKLKKEGSGFGVASCDSCHTRHRFSAEEARQPQACQTCHMGFDHPQWEMYSGSKHGVRFLLKQTGALARTTVAPSCQTCHMQKGDHDVGTAWGFLAVRLPMPEDKQWAQDRATILKALGVLDPDGKPTARLDVVKAADLARLTQDDWQQERDKMTHTCTQCHSKRFARSQLKQGDDLIRQVDHLMAQAIDIVAGLYRDSIINKPANYAHAYPDLLTFHDAPTAIEQRLFVMFLKHRMRAFQGAFHANPDYALWYGWSEMQQDLTDIRSMADELRWQSRDRGR